jgi:hypothetical protein
VPARAAAAGPTETDSCPVVGAPLAGVGAAVVTPVVPRLSDLVVAVSCLLATTTIPTSTAVPAAVTALNTG